MHSVDLNDYIEEYSLEGLTLRLYHFICDAVAQVITQYPPHLYSPEDVWNEDSVAGVCNEFIVTKLLSAGRLNYHFHTQDTIAGLRGVLQRDVRHFLINQMRRNELSNIYRRVKRIISNDARFQVVQEGHPFARTVFGLKGWGEKEIIQRLQDVVEAMNSLSLPARIRYSEESKKLSPLISNDDLANLVYDTVQTADKNFNVAMIMEGLRYRLGLLAMREISLDELVTSDDSDGELTYAEIVRGDTNTERDVIARQIADLVFSVLSARQRQVLCLSSPDSTAEALGAYLGISKSTVSNEWKRIAQHIKMHGVSPDEFEAVMTHLYRLCAAEIDLGEE